MADTQSVTPTQSPATVSSAVAIWCRLLLFLQPPLRLPAGHHQVSLPHLQRPCTLLPSLVAMLCWQRNNCNWCRRFPFVHPLGQFASSNINTALVLPFLLPNDSSTQPFLTILLTIPPASVMFQASSFSAIRHCHLLLFTPMTVLNKFLRACFFPAAWRSYCSQAG